MTNTIFVITKKRELRGVAPERCWLTLSKNLFPVCRTKTKKSLEVGIFFPFHIFLDWHNIVAYIGCKLRHHEQNCSLPFYVRSGGNQETSFYLRAASGETKKKKFLVQQPGV